MPIDPREFRRVMGTFATGVTVITIPTREGAWGMTANAVSSLSLEPTLVLVCIEKTTRTHALMLESDVWAVNILSAKQEAISRTFALKDSDEQARAMSGTSYRRGVTGAPIIEGCLSYLDCRTWATYDGGDHTLFLGEVQDAAVVDPDSPPLLFFKGRYARLAEPAR
jgi:flavin reductase (DIM6/NTAB) family NADH-FMN oxidoreductase RutF